MATDRTLPVGSEPLALRPILIVGWDDNGQLHAWASPDYPQQIQRFGPGTLRREVLAAAEAILNDLERPIG
jgi:hypothetical protein